MAVNLPEPASAELHRVSGVRLGSAYAGIRSKEADDVLLMQFDPGATAAGVFTRNRFCAAPVTVCREHLAAQGGEVRAIVVNAGNANAGTGQSGLDDARATCQSVAALLNCSAEHVLPLSTGVILEPLPVDRLTGVLPDAVSQASEENWLTAARAIMTTDTVPKAVTRTGQCDGGEFTVTGIAKGAGMIRPDMGTMLSVVTTDAAVPVSVLQHWIREATEQSFNRITVDGDTSTNDSLLIVATGQGSLSVSDANAPGAEQLKNAIFDVTRQLAQAIVRDGEGATKFITVRVEQAANDADARAIAYSIAHSPLVKTAFFASDPNLGRLLCAIGYAQVSALDVSRLELLLDDVVVASGGGRDPDYREEDGQAVMSRDEITVTARLGLGDASTTVWTCDLSHDYVTINAEYRT